MGRLSTAIAEPRTSSGARASPRLNRTRAGSRSRTRRTPTRSRPCSPRRRWCIACGNCRCCGRRGSSSASGCTSFDTSVAPTRTARRAHASPRSAPPSGVGAPPSDEVSPPDSAEAPSPARGAEPRSNARDEERHEARRGDLDGVLDCPLPRRLDDDRDRPRRHGHGLRPPSAADLQSGDARAGKPAPILKK
jgi:hypothetical protein